MTKTEYRQYIASPEWQEKRKVALLVADNRCEACEIPRWLASIAYDQDLHVHHLHYQNVGNEQTGDLQVLCRRCHEVSTFGRSSLKEPQNSKCETCQRTHWNPYSDQCDICSLMTSPDFPLPLIYGGWDSLRGDATWVVYLEEMIRSVQHGLIPVDQLLEVIGKAVTRPSSKAGI